MLVGWLIARMYVFARFATVSLAVQIMGRELLHPMGRVIVIATSSSTLPSEGKLIPDRVHTLLTYAFKT